MFHTIQLSKMDPTPLYIQLASEIAKLIHGGILSGGTKLPPIRVLSARLSINRDTVVSSYKLLENQGLVEAHVGKGTYVANNAQMSAEVFPLDEKSDIYCSSLGFPKDLFPESFCMHLTESILQKEGWGAFSDPLNREKTFLKQSACCFLEEAGIQSSFAQIRIIKRYKDFLNTLFKYSSKQGVCIEAFSELIYSSYLRSIGAKIYEIPLTKEGLDLNVLEKQLHNGNIGYIFLSTYLQNPTGTCYSEENKRKIVELAKAYDCLIIEDGTFSEFVYEGIQLKPLFDYFSKDRVIYVYHFSKVYFPYLAYSFVLLPIHLLKPIADKLECTFNEYLLHYYLESNEFKTTRFDLIVSSREKYKRLHDGLLELKNKIEIYSSHGGIFFWLKPLTLTLDEVYHLLIHNGIVVSPGTLFTFGNKSDYFRLSISTLTEQHVEKIIKLLTENL